MLSPALPHIEGAPQSSSPSLFTLQKCVLASSPQTGLHVIMTELTRSQVPLLQKQTLTLCMLSLGGGIFSGDSAVKRLPPTSVLWLTIGAAVMAHWLCEGDVGLPSAAGVVPRKRWKMVPECAKHNLQKCCQLPSKFTPVVNMPSLALVWGATFTKAAAGICLLHFFCCISSWLGLPFSSSAPTSPSLIHNSIHVLIRLFIRVSH